MPQMHIWKITQVDQKLNQMISFFLLDEQQQALLALQWAESRQSSVRLTPQPGKAITEPLSIDLLARVLHTLDGTLESITLDTLPEGQLYAQVHVHDRDGQQHTVRAPLSDALRLAHREHVVISVPAQILDQRGIKLAEDGPTQKQQLANAARLAERSPGELRRLLLPKEPHNLDFSAGRQGWIYDLDGEEGSYIFDSHVPFAGRASMAITVNQRYSSGEVLLMHQPFLADHYCGRRVRLAAQVKVEQRLRLALMVHVDERVSYSRHLPLTPASDWIMQELVIELPADARSLRFSLGTNERGKLWLGGIQFEAVHQSIPLTPGTTIQHRPAEQPTNLDFAQGLESWGIESHSPWHYEYGIESHATPRASGAAYLKALVAVPDGGCVLTQKIRTGEYSGKRVRLRALLKTVDVEPQASFFIGRLAGGTGGERCEELLKGTTDWHVCELSWQAPQEPFPFDAIGFGASLYGRGRVWLADVSLEIPEN